MEKLRKIYESMIYIVSIALILFLFTGCATTEKPYVEVAPIKPEAKIMKDCGDYILPENTAEDFVRAISKNQDIFNECKNQNQGKKVFIEKVTK